MSIKLLSQKTIKKKILENYLDYQYMFVEFQSKFLSGLHTRYQSVENGNLVLYYERQTHQAILRKKDYDLDFNLSYEKFWENHREISLPQISINKIGEDVLLPKETTRRKILQLTKQKVLNKKDRKIRWLPSEQYKESHNLAFSNEIDEVCKLINFICDKTNLSISREEVAKEIKEKFSFYWFHYLGVQLEYLRLWNKQLKDLELGLIFLQVAHLFSVKAKKNFLSPKDFYDDPSLLKEYIGASVSASSISEVTGIPRATCVRKLKTLVSLKKISQDEISKRYYIISNATSEGLISNKITGKVVKIFSNFFFICIRATSVRT